MSQLQQFLRSERLEIKPSLGDGHCLQAPTNCWVCSTYNNQLPQLPPLRKQDLINAIEREFQDHSESYLVFYTKTREQFFSELYHYKTQKIQF